jgi:hypothetical protein
MTSNDIPGEFTGGWVRNGIAFDGQPATEDAVVWWLQTPTRHADLRVPRGDSGTPMSFAGHTVWDGTALTWVREVDLDNSEDVDTGTTARDGPDLLESGSFEDADGTPRTYVERWVRLPGSEEPLWEFHDGSAYAVRAGEYAITLVDERPTGGVFRSTAWSVSGARWHVHHTLPGVPLAPTPANWA